MDDTHKWLDAEDLEFLRECCYNDRPMVLRLLADLDAAKAIIRRAEAELRSEAMNLHAPETRALLRKYADRIRDEFPDKGVDVEAKPNG